METSTPPRISSASAAIATNLLTMAASMEIAPTWVCRAPTETAIHDLGSGVGGFASLIYNRTPADQFRLVTSARRDHYQVPNIPTSKHPAFATWRTSATRL